MARYFGRFFRNKRGITPVLSNLLLMLVAVAVMALATTATYVITTNLRENMSERVVVEDLWLNNSTGSISAYLHNVGKVAIQVSAVYVNHTRVTLSSYFSLEIGQHGWLNVSYGQITGGLYYIDIVTNRGTHVGGYCKTS